ncbi:MAG: deoxyribodipyrimidine photo-lyase [Pseudomonadales bacterium]|nr:deoxyribodipyrimidine photo-lyase [Pseudomonadales bacterium]
MLKKQLHWFRSDLRIHDNQALAQALAAGPTVALYIAVPQQWQAHADAPIKLDLWRRQLMALEQSLKQMAVPLLFIEVPDYRQVPAVFAELIDRLALERVFFNAEYPLNERTRDQAVRAACQALGVIVSTCDDQVLLAPGRVLTQAAQPFKVFTPFARKAREYLESAAPAVLRPRPGPAQSLALLPANLPIKGRCKLDDIGWPSPTPQQGQIWQTLWPAGEACAREALQRWCQQNIAAYRKTRDFPELAGTSGLSAYLACGAISIRECWMKAAAYQDGEGVETWRNELLWRDFYKHILVHFPHVCRNKPWRQDLEHVRWRHDDDDYKRWCQGETGFPLIDAAMRQLLDTGWMHNRLRMLSAMFFSKHLLLDWRLGERWFMQHLVDGDFSANNGGWQWSASTGTDAVPYFRLFNPLSQSRRFDPQGHFIRRFIPELAGLDDKAIHMPGPFKPSTYPAPMLDLAFGRKRALAAFARPGHDPAQEL